MITSALASHGSTLPRGLHVAIVMDGNGRWAERRGLPRSAGHQAGSGAVRRTVEAAATLGIGTLTLYAFSSDNWRRPTGEVTRLMRLLRTHLQREAGRCVREGVRVSVIGRRDRLGPDLVSAIQAAEAVTRGGRRLHLQLAVDYSARDAILEAVRRYRAKEVSRPVRPLHTGDLESEALSRDAFAGLIAEALHAAAPVPEVDLLIRTGGEQRLSDFLLWECAYAELLFTPCLWPDFGESELTEALREFRGRSRRFGGLPAASRAAPAAAPSRRSPGTAEVHGHV